MIEINLIDDPLFNCSSSVEFSVAYYSFANCWRKRTKYIHGYCAQEKHKINISHLKKRLTHLLFLSF